MNTTVRRVAAIGASAFAVFFASASANVVAECGAADLQSYFGAIDRDDPASIGGGAARTFDFGDLECLEKVKNGIEPTHHASAESGVSYVRLHFKVVSFDNNVEVETLRPTLGKFLRRFFIRKEMTNTLDVEVKSNDIVIGIEHIISVSYQDKTKFADYSTDVFLQGPLTPWVPVTETGSIEFALKGRAINQPNFRAVKTLLDGAKLAAGLQTSPTRVLSSLTAPHFVSGAQAINEKMQIELERNFSPAIEILLNGGDNNTAGMYFELYDLPEVCVEKPTSRDCRRVRPQGPVQPRGGVIIYPVYQNSLMADARQVIESTNIPNIRIEASKIRNLSLGPLGVSGRPNLLEFLRNERSSLYDNLRSRQTNAEQFEQECNTLADFISGQTGLQYYDRAAMMWAFMQISKAYSQPEVQQASNCPERRTREAFNALRLEQVDIATPISAADVEKSLKVVEDAIFDLSLNRGSALARRERAFRRFSGRVRKIKAVDRTELIAPGLRNPVEIDLELAMNIFLEPIAKRFPITCSSSQAEIAAAQGGESPTDRHFGYILLASENVDDSSEFAEMVINFEQTTKDIPIVSISPLPLDFARARRDEYPGCSPENFPLPGDG